MESDTIADFIHATNKLAAKHKSLVVVLDIDDTIGESADDLATPNWFYGMVKKLREHGYDKVSAYQAVGNILERIDQYVSFIPIEKELIKAITDWQAQGIKVVALTSRSSSLAQGTQEALNKLGVHLYDKSFRCINAAWEDKKAVFHDGVLYVNSLPKNEVLAHFLNALERCGAKASAIAHADDQKMYVEQIYALAQEKKLPFVGIVYGGAVNKRQFDMNRANQQLQALETKLETRFVSDKLRPLFSMNP